MTEDKQQPTPLRKFICIDYPGVVENEAEAIRTLGGYDRIYQAFARKNSKILVNYTPDNIFSKMICSVQIDEPDSNNDQDAASSQNDAGENDLSDLHHDTSGQLSRDTTNLKNKNTDFIMPCLIMSVKKSTSEPTKYESKIIGKVKKMYCFTKMADFQYLPMGNVSSKQTASNPDTAAAANLSPKSAAQTQFNYNAFYENFLFSNIDNYQQELKVNNLPQLFILPPFFSRFDDPINYAFRAEPNKKEPTERLAAAIESSATQQGLEKSKLNKSSHSSDKSDKTFNSDDSENGVDDSDEDEMDDEANDSRNEKSGYSTDNSEKKRAVDDGKDDSSSNLIRSRRQERSSQAVLVTYLCKEVPASKEKVVRVRF
jgi:hypothetical protein